LIESVTSYIIILYELNPTYGKYFSY